MNLSNPCRRTTGLASLCIDGFTKLLITQLSEKITCMQSANKHISQIRSTEVRTPSIKLEGRIALSPSNGEFRFPFPPIILNNEPVTGITTGIIK